MAFQFVVEGILKQVVIAKTTTLDGKSITFSGVWITPKDKGEWDRDLFVGFSQSKNDELKKLEDSIGKTVKVPALYTTFGGKAKFRALE